MRGVLLGLCAVLAIGTRASHAAPQDEGECYGFSVDDEPRDYALQEIVGEGRAYFILNASENPSCPSDGAACRRKGYVLSGDAVIAGPDKGGYRCAIFMPARGEAVTGWLPAGRLSPKSDTPTGWLGEWQRGGLATIAIKPGKTGLLLLSGDAASRPGDSPNLGSFVAEAKPEGADLRFAIQNVDGEDRTVPFAEAGEDSCALRLRRVGAYLLVQDNEHCGGAGARFLGVYRRQ